MKSKAARLAKRALAGLLLLAAASCGKADSPQASTSPAAPIEVSWAEAETRMVERTAEVVGTLLAREEVTIRAEAEAAVIAVQADFGERVRKGQQLALLDPTQARLEEQRAAAALSESLAALGLGPDGDEKGILAEDQPSVRQVAWKIADARTKLESARQLVETKDIPEQRFLELQKEVARLEAEMDEAKDRVRSQVTSVGLRRAELALARDRLRKTRILAPFDGEIRQRMIGVGDFAQENDPLFILVKVNPLRLRARIPETAVAAVRPGLAVHFRTDAYPGRDFEATITEIGPVLDASSRSLAAEASVENADNLLKPGMFATVQVTVAAQSPALMVPREAVLEYGGLHKVFVIGADKKVQELTIEPGLEVDGWVEVASAGLEEGQKVATSSLARLSRGVTVTASQ